MSDPNPFVDPGPFGTVYVDDQPVLATLIEVDDAENPEEWQQTKGSGSSGETADWKGMKLVQTMKLKWRATDEASYDAMTALLAYVRPKRGNKPRTVTIENGIINWGGALKFRLVKPPTPKWVPAQQCWDFTWEFGEWSPSKPTKTGPAGPAKPEDPGAAASPTDPETAKLEGELKGALGELEALRQGSKGQ